VVASGPKMTQEAIKLISSEGYEYIIDYKAACISNTIKNMLGADGATQRPYGRSFLSAVALQCSQARRGYCMQAHSPRQSKVRCHLPRFLLEFWSASVNTFITTSRIRARAFRLSGPTWHMVTRRRAVVSVLPAVKTLYSCLDDICAWTLATTACGASVLKFACGTRRSFTMLPDFQIDPTIALHLLRAADYLDT
jgi:Skp1 family, tetramerisation domain